MDKYITSVAILVVSLLLFGNLQQYNHRVYDYNKDTQLRANINMASDTALYKMITESEDLGLDYYYFGRVNINPRVGVDTFRRTLAQLQYDTDSDMALGLIDSSYIGGMIICYDGYYLIPNLTDPIVKLPFTYNDDSGKRYLVDLTDKYLSEVNISTGRTSKITIEDSEKSKISRSLELLVNKELNLMIQNYYGSGSLYEIYTPMFRRILNSTNAIDSTCCIFLMDNNDTRLPTPVYSVSGSSIVFNRFCFGYTRNGMKFYTHLYNRDKVEEPIEKMFMSKTDAARNGYVFDLKYEIN